MNTLVAASSLAALLPGAANAAAREALADAGVRKRLSDLGQIIPPPAQQTPEALAAHQKAENDKRWPLIRAANIKVE